MTYEEARAFIEGSNQYGSKLGLETITELLRRLDNPQDKLRVIHIAGTNGKGSTTAFITAVLASQGYVTGRYISPAVFTYCERIQISKKAENSVDTQYITEEGIIDAISLIRPVCEAMVLGGFPHPTSFEIETAMAFLYLVRENVDYAVIEVGMGGRLDATNVIKKPVCCVITSISMDHMQYLGDTLGKIATEKAGIIKTGTPVVTGNTDPEVIEVLKRTCEERGARFVYADVSEAVDRQFSPEETSFTFQSQNFKIRLLGEYQISNALLAIKTAECLSAEGIELSKDTIKNGLFMASWSGRLELLRKEPYFIIDGAHNEDAAWQLRKALEIYFPGRRLIYIIGVLADKDYPRILSITAGLAQVIYTITPNNARGLNSALLAAEARKHCSGRVIDAGNVMQAVRSAYQEAGIEDAIIAFGSLSFLAEVKEYAT
jgi:dihydrofolate synthase/folylpolyglutamate synthase